MNILFLLLKSSYWWSPTYFSPDWWSPTYFSPDEERFFVLVYKINVQSFDCYWMKKECHNFKMCTYLYSYTWNNYYTHISLTFRIFSQPDFHNYVSRGRGEEESPVKEGGTSDPKMEGAGEGSALRGWWVLRSMLD